jgi:hypothetical protein
MTIFFRVSMLLLFMNLTSSCSDPKTNAPTAEATPPTAPTAELKTITGTVTAITNGKDGYSAEVLTETDGSYAAMVSMVNMGGPDKYQSCNVGDKVSFKGVSSMMGDAKHLQVKEIIGITPVAPVETQMLIATGGFRGITIGDKIANYTKTDYVKKTKMKTGEGTFEVYEIRDFENNPAGYFMPDTKNKLLVGDITVQSPKASTDKGINVGDTFQDLLKVYPDIEVHGSEIESRTYANVKNISYRLAAANASYELDRAKIPASTKITEIIIAKK